MMSARFAPLGIVVFGMACQEAKPKREPKMIALPSAEVALGGIVFTKWEEANYVMPEAPVHRARIGGFSIDETEVTVAAFERCVKAKTCVKPAEPDSRCNGLRSDRRDHPANCVTYDEAAKFCAWAGKRLPTEDEWEYAARGAAGRTYPWGEASPGEQLCWRHAGTCEVASFPSGRTPEGLFDMAGNVWEWTSSRYRIADGVFSVRGGPLAYGHDDPIRARSAYRVSTVRHAIEWDLGFRCVKDPI